jgi:hypothetical protein
MTESESYINKTMREHLKNLSRISGINRIVFKVYGFKLYKTAMTLLQGHHSKNSKTKNPNLVPKRLFKMPVVGYSNFEAWAEYDFNSTEKLTSK